MATHLEDMKCKLLVIGAGPGGYVCAIRAGHLGVDTVIVEKALPGGTCLNVGCIPSKALIHAADAFHELAQAAAGQSKIGLSAADPQIDFAATLAWKDGIVARLNGGVGGLLKRAGVRSVTGEARFLDGKRVEVATADGPQVIEAEAVVIATGSAPVELPFLPFGGDVISSTEALALPRVPQSLVVVGGGYIGLELGMAYAKLGAKVKVIEAGDRILPQYDADLTKPVAARLAALGVEVLTGAKARGLAPDKAALEVEGPEGPEGEAQLIRAEKYLVTVGRTPVVSGWGKDNLVLDMNGPFIAIDDRCQTSMRGIYAVGDVTGEPMLAHRAMAQGEMVADIVAGERRSWDKYCIPAVCFTDPEIVSAGLSPAQAKAQGLEIKTGIFPFQANGRAMTQAREDGFVRVVALAENHLVIGIQAVGAHISEMSASFALAIEMGARLEDIAHTVHAHPTQGESLQEASMKALGTALHV
jgi:dihydrolipoamide dehydrogenase